MNIKRNLFSHGAFRAILTLYVLTSFSPAGATTGGASPRLLPVFEENRGQAPRATRYLLHASGFTVLCGKQNCTWRSPRHEMTMEWLGASRVTPRGINALPRVHRYYQGKRRWVVPTYQKVVYSNIYPHIDLELRVDAEEVEYDWIVRPGGSPDAIRARFRGQDAARVAVNKNGDLVLGEGSSNWIHRAPTVYQEKNGLRIPVSGHFAADDQGAWQFAIGKYDESRLLVIDPKVSLSTKIGDAQAEDIDSVAVNGGQIYVAGSRLDLTLFQTGIEPKRDIFLAKVDSVTGTPTFVDVFKALNPAPDKAVGLDEDAAYVITVDSSTGAVYLAGTTKSFDFPMPPLTKQPQREIKRDGFGNIAGTDAFIARFDANLALENATYLGGDGGDGIRAIKVRGQYIYVVGSSDSINFPEVSSVGYERGGSQAFVAKIIENSNTDWGLAFSSLIGGSGYEKGVALDLDAADNIYVAGHTNSNNLSAPVDALGHNVYSYKSFAAGGVCTRGGLASEIAAGSNCLDAFLLKLTPKSVTEPNLYHIAFSTYFGGIRDELATSLAVDPQGGGIVIAGSEQSPLGGLTSGLPLPAGDVRLNFFPSFHQPAGLVTNSRGPADYDAFVAMFASNGGELLFSVSLGGSSNEGAEALSLFPYAGGAKVDVILAGYTASENFPLKNAAQGFVRQSDGFFARLAFGYAVGATNASVTLTYSSLFGGTAMDYIYGIAPLDTLGKQWVFAGATDSIDLPLTTGTSKGARDGWLMIWDESDATQVDLTLTASASASAIDKGQAVNFDLSIGNIAPSGDQVYLWIEFPEEHASYSISMFDCQEVETFLSCPISSTTPMPVTLRVTPSFRGDYPMRFGVSGLYTDPVYNNNLVYTNVEVKQHRSRGASEIWVIVFLFSWLLWSRRRKRVIM